MLCKKSALFGAVASLALLAAAGANAQDKVVELKMSTWVPPAHPLHGVIKEWADSIESQSGGTIKLTLFTSQQLGKAHDHFDMTRDKIADFAYVNPGYQPGRFPIASAAELPFLTANASAGSAAFDAWYRPYAVEEMKDIHYCLGFVGEPGGLHGKRELVVPENLQGLKLGSRNWTNSNFVTMLGASNVQVSAPESREVLERGVADAVFFPWGSLFLFNLDKVTTHHLDMPLYVGNFVWAMNKRAYETMSDQQRAVIDDHCTTEWAEKFGTPWGEFEAAGRDKIIAAGGHTITVPTEEQVKKWRAAAQPLVEQWAEPVRAKGLDSQAILDAYKKELADRGALY